MAAPHWVCRAEGAICAVALSFQRSFRRGQDCGTTPLNLVFGENSVSYKEATTQGGGPRRPCAPPPPASRGRPTAPNIIGGETLLQGCALKRNNIAKPHEVSCAEGATLKSCPHASVCGSPTTRLFQALLNLVFRERSNGAKIQGGRSDIQCARTL